jgi:hypothetical protein
VWSTASQRAVFWPPVDVNIVQRIFPEGDWKGPLAAATCTTVVDGGGGVTVTVTGGGAVTVTGGGAATVIVDVGAAGAGGTAGEPVDEQPATARAASATTHMARR